MVEHEYRYWTEWSDEDREWVGLCDGFPLVSWLESDRQAAEAGIRSVVAEVVEDLRTQGKPLPEPSVRWPPRAADSQRPSPVARSEPA